MKRRNFIGLIGAAIAAPALPMAAPAAGYSRVTYGLAVLHARTRAHVSARGLSYCLKVNAAQAEAMVAEMSAKGLVRPIAGGSVRAVSNILNPGVWGTVGASTAKPITQQPKVNLRLQSQNVDLSTMMAHLHKLCRSRGMVVAA